MDKKSNKVLDEYEEKDGNWKSGWWLDGIYILWINTIYKYNYT